MNQKDFYKPNYARTLSLTDTYIKLGFYTPKDLFLIFDNDPLLKTHFNYTVTFWKILKKPK